MCGFVCLWNIDDETLAARMLARIAHRGPDEQKIIRLPGAILAHARLAIIGPEDGTQPLVSGDRALVVNGEIYNHADLRKIAGPEKFATHSDSETIMHLMTDDAPRWIAKLDGMFAFVLLLPGRLIAARDPLGIKPLYKARMQGGLAFASEVKAFDGERVDHIEAVKPGSLWDSRDGERQWHRMPSGQAEPEAGLDEEKTAAELRLVFEAAVHKWMVADVELGAFLSGGLDSSAVAAVAAREMARSGMRLKTFAVGTKGSPDLVAAARVAAHIGSEHFERVFTPEDLINAMPDVISAMESADVDLVPSALPTHIVSVLARQYVKAVLTGEGADELFAGYRYHHDYAGKNRALADELTRSLGTMHNINLQRVDRITMALGLEGRTPFLDRDLIAFAQTIPASLKMKVNADGSTTEKWIFRKAVAGLLPDDIVWRTKAQFDEGSGSIDALRVALSGLTGKPAPVSRDDQAACFRAILESRFIDPALILSQAGTWTAARVMV